MTFIISSYQMITGEIINSFIWLFNSLMWLYNYHLIIKYENKQNEKNNDNQ